MLIDLAATALCLVAATFTPALAQTATPTPTGTATPTPTPTSCRGALPVVAPVTSPTDLLEQTIYFCGRIVGSSSMTVTSDVGGSAHDIGFADRPCPFSCDASCNQATVPLAPNEVNHITVCQRNATCGAGGCVTVDFTGQSLDIAQLLPTPTHPPAIPAVSSPGSPAGLAMIALLVVAMVWLLRQPKVGST